VGLKGRYRFVVRDAATHQIKRETDWIENIITDLGLNTWGGGFSLTYCHIGTGTSTPATTDTALQSFSASTSSTGSSTGNLGTPTYVGYRTWSYRFNVGVLNGNYSEVGVGSSNTTGNLFSRALIVDGGGSPTTITIISTEYLDVYYQLQVVPPLTDATSTITVTGLGSIDVTRRALNVGSWKPHSSGPYYPMTQSNPFGNYIASNTLVAYTASGIGGTYLGGSNNSYVNLSYERGFAFGVGIGSAVTYGLISMQSGDQDGLIAWQFSLNPVINKTALQTLSLYGKVTWARA